MAKGKGGSESRKISFGKRKKVKQENHTTNTIVNQEITSVKVDNIKFILFY